MRISPAVLLQVNRLAATLAALLLASGLAPARATPPASEKDVAPDLAGFEAELRSALAASDAGRMALLVRFPLRVNGGGGVVTSLDNPRALQARFEDAFPPELRAKVLGASAADVVYRGGTFGFARGTLWVERLGEDRGARYRLVVVNLPEAASDCRWRCPGALAFVCDAAEHRAIIDYDKTGAPRLRAWTKPRALGEAPDLELAPGSESWEGTSPCGHTIWTFRNGEVVHTISERGCGGDDDADVVGYLSVERPETEPREWECR